jgi:beta-phosphoglucomutase-like phosphatase (HAD superfamily)
MDGVIVDTEPVHRYAYFKQLIRHRCNRRMYTIHWFSRTFKAKETFGLENDVEELIQRKRTILMMPLILR